MTSFNAFPPTHLAWQIGKTASSVAFVADAESFLATGTDSPQKQCLRETIEKIKNGDIVLSKFFTVEEWLAQNFPEHTQTFVDQGRVYERMAPGIGKHRRDLEDPDDCAI